MYNWELQGKCCSDVDASGQTTALLGLVSKHILVIDQPMEGTRSVWSLLLHMKPSLSSIVRITSLLSGQKFFQMHGHFQH